MFGSFMLGMGRLRTGSVRMRFLSARPDVSAIMMLVTVLPGRHDRQPFQGIVSGNRDLFNRQGMKV